MERIRAFIEGEGLILLIMALFTWVKSQINKSGPIDWIRGMIQVFTNFVAGWGFYSLILSYDDWMGKYPQKVGVIMIVTYAGSRLIDVIVDKLYNLDWKEALRRWLNL